MSHCLCVKESSCRECWDLAWAEARSGAVPPCQLFQGPRIDHKLLHDPHGLCQDLCGPQGPGQHLQGLKVTGVFFETLKIITANYNVVVGIAQTLRVLAKLIVSLKILDVFRECLGFLAAPCLVFVMAFFKASVFVSEI